MLKTTKIEFLSLSFQVSVFSVQQTSLSQRTPNIENGTVPKQDFVPELTCPPPREAAMFMGGVRYGPWRPLPKVQCPVLALEGAGSDNRSFIDLEKEAAGFPNLPMYDLSL